MFHLSIFYILISLYCYTNINAKKTITELPTNATTTSTNTTSKTAIDTHVIVVVLSCRIPLV